VPFFVDALPILSHHHHHHHRIADCSLLGSSTAFIITSHLSVRKYLDTTSTTTAYTVQYLYFHRFKMSSTSPSININMNMNHNQDEDDEFYDVAEASESASASGEHQSHVDDEGDLNSSLIMDREQLEKCGQWLLSIPRDDVVALRKTPEYTDFLKSFEKLGLAHRRAYGSSSSSSGGGTNNGNNKSSDGIKSNGDHDHHHSSSFLQHLEADDVVLRVLEFLECQSLIPTSQTCSRFRELATQSATQRTAAFRRCRLLNTNVMKLLRATEEMESSWHGAQEIIPSVPIPLLGLERRVAVTDAGDSEYNGIYYCTASDGNGFVFTKPRNETSRASMSQAAASGISGAAATANRMVAVSLQAMDVEQLMQPLHPLISSSHRQEGALVVSAGNLEEPAQPGQLLRCFIAKRFSNEVRFCLTRFYVSLALLSFFALRLLCCYLPCTD
jgi:hypothetical protein